MSTSGDDPPASAGPAPTSAAGNDPRVTWLRRAIWVVLIAGVLAFLVQGADAPPDPLLVPAVDTSTTTTTAERSASAADEGLVALPPPSVSSSLTSLAPTIPSTSARPATPSTAEETPVPAPATTSEPPPPTSVAEAPSTSSTASVRSPLPGFRQTSFRVTDADGEVVDGVAMLAADPTSRQRGLMGQSDLRGYDAMIFRFDSPSTGTFFMRNTILPLSIAFFDRNGRFVSATDMEPCPDELATCPSYAAARPYLHAVEVVQGDLPQLGIGPGSVLSFPIR